MLLALLWAAIPLQAAAQFLVTEQCMGPSPQGAGTPANQVIVRPAYTLSNNPVTKFADWIAYAVDARNFGPSRLRDWRADLDRAETVDRMHVAEALAYRGRTG